ncbi:MAG: type II secretion system protein [Chlorogloeopsis fritschii C42_A2020_084]|uniref:hormogonium polysaccharide secretion pseudopilin HpsB n=1 Tax=Chlorogloeopsis fritschii TaxID=1124 RepID=UPI0019F58595|nr:hormogonium polysaccharide secretion pseudopilin HpsB [Chlorogloeopsis fritschii]MBF2004624.1 type II secretion system protein [Chlorogloeopsis fritschii C42_A2020_084]
MIKLKPQQQTSSSSDSGFTIIESLLAIIVVAILLAAISPVLVMSTSIRVQSRRIEKANQAANTFIDGVRTGSIKAPGEYSNNNKISLDPATASQPRNLDENLINLTKMPVPATKDDSDLYLFQKDGIICHTSETGCAKNSDSPFDEFYIQARQIIVTGSGVNDGYRLVIRVYRSDVDFNKPLLTSTGNSTKQTASAVTAGVGNRQAPAIEKTADVGNITTTFQALCRRLGVAPDKDGNNQNCQ